MVWIVEWIMEHIMVRIMKRIMVRITKIKSWTSIDKWFSKKDDVWNNAFTCEGGGGKCTGGSGIVFDMVGKIKKGLHYTVRLQSSVKKFNRIKKKQI